MTQPHPTTMPAVRRRPRARITPLALLRARAHQYPAQPARRPRAQSTEDR
jgi:hypothetical protein